jgi:transposase
VKEIIRIGVDTSKSVFQLHGVDAAEQPVLRRKLRRSQVLEFFGKLPPTRVGMEACGAAHHWARDIGALGHEAMLLPPQLVKRESLLPAPAERLGTGIFSMGRNTPPTLYQLQGLPQTRQVYWPADLTQALPRFCALAQLAKAAPYVASTFFCQFLMPLLVAMPGVGPMPEPNTLGLQTAALPSLVRTALPSRAAAASMASLVVRLII